MITALFDTNCRKLEQQLRSALVPFVAKSDYSVVWKEYEKQAIKEFESAVRTVVPPATPLEFDEGEVGKDKNRLADVAVRSGNERILISVKACRSDKDPANDLGTLRQYEEKKASYSASFDIWVKYDDSVLPPKVRGVYFDRSYRFVGQMSRPYGGGVSYRKKDGNMRPKSWGMFDDGICFWNTLEEFEAGIVRSKSFRANSIVCEHLEDMTEADKRALLEKLKRYFGIA
jgi:hypothetical protein